MSLTLGNCQYCAHIYILMSQLTMTLSNHFVPTYLAFFSHLSLSTWYIKSENNPYAMMTVLKDASFLPLYAAWRLRKLVLPGIKTLKWHFHLLISRANKWLKLSNTSKTHHFSKLSSLRTIHNPSKKDSRSLSISLAGQDDSFVRLC
jgi:hypothetical protein